MNKKIMQGGEFFKGLLKKKHADEGAFFCPVCNAKTGISSLPLYYFEQMHRFGLVHSIFLTETINIINYSCDKCGASDRDRLYALYLNEYLVGKNVVSLLDIAPSAALREFLKKSSKIIYRSADLNMPDVDDNVDIMDMKCYEDETFDFFICSHVLEHVPDDIKAMNELYRILKKNACGILMVPINLGVEKTLEDPSCDDIAFRWKYFGQDDHVRMYNKQDYISRLEKAGFEVTLLGEDFFGREKFETAGIYPTSVLYIVTK